MLPRQQKELFRRLTELQMTHECRVCSGCAGRTSGITTDIYGTYTLWLGKIHWLIFCSTSVQYEPIPISNNNWKDCPRLKSLKNCPLMPTSRKSLQYAALGTDCTLTAVSRSTQPSTLREMVNDISTSWLSNNTWRKVNVLHIAAYKQIQRRSLHLRVGGHLVLTDFHPEQPQWTLAYGWCRRWQHYKYCCNYY